ncbi:MAG: hypothetical protein K2N05_03920 [Muribaculaceae bacterium]|nr:hypothetical protein [Muribaculaceae bacterium]
MRLLDASLDNRKLRNFLNLSQGMADGRCRCRYATSAGGSYPDNGVGTIGVAAYSAWDFFLSVRSY